MRSFLRPSDNHYRCSREQNHRGGCENCMHDPAVLPVGAHDILAPLPWISKRPLPSYKHDKSPILQRPQSGLSSSLINPTGIPASLVMDTTPAQRSLPTPWAQATASLRSLRGARETLSWPQHLCFTPHCARRGPADGPGIDGPHQPRRLCNGLRGSLPTRARLQNHRLVAALDVPRACRACEIREFLGSARG